jgi:PhzF family phenazine biosynthesis protein
MFVEYITAFSNKEESGNPAAIYIVDDFFSTAKMQSISTKENLSETAFVRKIADGKYHIRWFTPVSEAPICIHATLAAAYALYNDNYVDSKKEIIFTDGKQLFNVWLKDGWVSLVFPNISIIDYQNMGATQELHLLERILRKSAYNYIGKSENILMVEFENEEMVNDFIPDLESIKQLPFRALLITSASKKYDFISRYFAPIVGIDEDPVCGSAHCRLIPYWAEKLAKDKMIAYQASSRGGVIKCENLKNKVVISGQAAIMSKNNI